MAPYESLYGRRCRSPIGWFEVGKPSLLYRYFVYKTLEKVHIIRNRFQTAYSQQKSYADHRRRDLEFEEGNKVHLKISPMKGLVRFGTKWKLSPPYVYTYEILQRVGKVSYELKLPSELSSIHPVFSVSMLKKYISDRSIFFLLRFLVSRITSHIRKFRFKFLIGKSRS